MDKQIINVNGMSCHHCEMTVEEAIMSLTGVVKAKASWKKKSVKVKFDSSLVTIAQIVTAINETGFEA